MLLTIDIGNTNLTLGLYRGREIVTHWRLATVHERMPDEYGLQFLGLISHAGFAPADLTGICMASVVPPPDRQNYRGLPGLYEPGAAGHRYRGEDRRTHPL